MYTPTDLIAFLIAVACIAFLVFLFSKKKEQFRPPAIEIVKSILEDHVLFYQRLTDTDKVLFEKRVMEFLKKIRITGVKTKVEDEDRIFIAAAAIIPIFHFRNWEYQNINEILL